MGDTCQAPAQLCSNDRQYGIAQVPAAEKARLREKMLKRREEQDAKALQEKLAASQEAAKQEAGVLWAHLCCAHSPEQLATTCRVLVYDLEEPTWCSCFHLAAVVQTLALQRLIAER